MPKYSFVESESQVVEEDLKARPFAKAFYCESCQKQLHLTPLEILRHKKMHMSEPEAPATQEIKQESL